MKEPRMSTTPSTRRPKAVISAGHKNFHLLFTASEMAKRDRLAMLITGAVPTAVERTLLSLPPLARSGKLQRFLNRQEQVPDALIYQSRLSEVVSSVGLIARKLSRYPRLDAQAQVAAMRAYGRRAARHLERHAPRGGIYHFRAGFGQSSIPVARDLGMTTICDHSIVHPALLEALVQNGGMFPTTRPPVPTGFWQLVMQDISAADLVLVNSDFVADSFVFMGLDPSKVRVAYQGAEDKFLSCLPLAASNRNLRQADPLRLLFAGGFTARKGAAELQAALAARPDLPITLDIAGSISAGDAERYAGLLADPRVQAVGMLSQRDLATLMSASDLLVFPTLAEGSARVVFEAMAAGCAVITTPNAGSVLRDGDGGMLIPPGQTDALINALEQAVQNRKRTANMGQHNYDLIRSRNTQSHYGDQIEEIYDSCLDTAAPATVKMAVS